MDHATHLTDTPVAMATNRSGRTGHAAITAREPDDIPTGERDVTVPRAEGDARPVYDGLLPSDRTRVLPSRVAAPRGPRRAATLAGSSGKPSRRRLASSRARNMRLMLAQNMSQVSAAPHARLPPVLIF